MPGDLLFGEKKYLETVFFVEKEIFWREEIPGSKKEALKTVAYHEISFFLVREKIHIFLQKKEGPRNSSIPGDFFLERTQTTTWKQYFFSEKEALETVACLETAPLPVEYGPPRAQSAAKSNLAASNR